MKVKKIRLVILCVLVIIALTATAVVLAYDGDAKNYSEGNATGQNVALVRSGIDSEKLSLEGQNGMSSALLSSGNGIDTINNIDNRGSEGNLADQNIAIDVAGDIAKRPYPEGEAASFSKSLQSAIDANLSVRYMFSGLTDDGKKGAADRKEATSILCTNTGSVNNQIYVELYQWSGAEIYTATITAPPMASYTFSTQNTTIYFDDIIFGTGGGTDSIFQGSAIILSEKPTLVCTVEVLDPLNYPPIYVTALELYKP